MPESPESSKLGVTPGKLVLIAVLAVVLVVVLAVQFGGVLGARPSAGEDSDGDGPQPGSSDRPAASRASPGGEPAVEQDDPNPWPRLELADVSAYDPFTLGVSAVQPAEPPAATTQRQRDRARQDQLLEQLQEQGVQAIVGSRRGGNVAVVGSEIVRVGDVLGELRVVAIEADGVVLERPAED